MKIFRPLFAVMMALVCAVSNSQTFTSGQTLTAAALNNAFASVLPKTGGTLTGPLAVTGALSSTGALTTAGLKEDTSGNLGLSVVPSAWRSINKALQIGNGASFGGIIGNNAAQMNSNAFINSGASWTYQNTDFATQYQQFQGAHSWYTAPSGTAGNPITFVGAMSLDTSSQLTVGGRITTVNSWITAGKAGAAYAYIGSAADLVGSGATADMALSTPGLNNMVFAVANVEKMRLDASGNLLVGTSSFASSNTNSLMFQVAAGAGYFQHAIGSASGSTYNQFNYNGAQIGSITQSGTTAVLYNTTSDRRLKRNIEDAPSASSDVDAIRIRSFDWKSDGSHQKYGVVAQELNEVAPYAVSKPEDPEAMMAVDYSKLVPLLVKEVQDLRKRVAALERRADCPSKKRNCRTAHRMAGEAA